VVPEHNQKIFKLIKLFQFYSGLSRWSGYVHQATGVFLINLLEIVIGINKT
jgi:hypothetical protein